MSNRTIVKNTAFLYGKMLITIFISLYSTRIVLKELGDIDYGVFSLVAGVIALLAFINGAMSVSTQRFISFFIGKKDNLKLDKIFNSSIILHSTLGIALFAVIEVVGLFLFNGILNIPDERLSVALYAYHFMALSTFVTVITVPYDAYITAYEHFYFDSLVGIFQTFFRLVIAVLLIYVDGDKLFVYSLLWMFSIVLAQVAKLIYCHLKFVNCKFSVLANFDYGLFKDMLSFSGWNFFGALCGVGIGQGIAIVLNMFLGPVVNAAYGISTQVRGQLQGFSQNMLRAISPQIMKNEGADNREGMLNLSMSASKYGFLLMAFFSIPFLFELEYVLDLWLGSYPKMTLDFCRLIIIASLVGQITIGLQTAIQATGQIKLYQIVVGGLLLLNVPIAYVLLSMNGSPISVLYSMILIEVVAAVLRIVMLKRIANLSVVLYLKNIILRILFVLPLPIFASICIQTIFTSSLFRLIILIIIESFVFLLSVYYLGFIKEERERVSVGFKFFIYRIFKTHNNAK